MGAGGSVAGSRAALSRAGQSPGAPHASIEAGRKLAAQDSKAPKDLMISYSHADKEMMLKIKEKLEGNGITVWVDVIGLNAGVDFLSKIGQAIIDAKLFISLLSKTSVKSKYCQDELALAYVSNTAIFPVTLVDPQELYPLMDTGMKLQLASYQWLSITDPNMFESTMSELLLMMRDVLDDKEKEEKKDEKPKLVRQATRTNINRRQLAAKNVKRETGETKSLMPEQYWKKFFIGETIDWNKFSDGFLSLYKEHLSETYTAEDQAWLLGILRREMEVDDDNVLDKASFIAFCTVDGEVCPLWSRVQDQARESYAMKEVFDMESSVRVEAIENLGRFRSSAVIDALRDLLTDSDANVRSVAAISLARTEANDLRTIRHLMKSLNDKDRLVREAGCLALGHLRAQAAVTKLLNMWRNDVISHVREAACVALQQIGGEEVDRAMHVTSVLAEEIRQLTSE